MDSDRHYPGRDCCLYCRDDVAFALGPWEYFSLCFVAITMVLAISKGNMFKGLGITVKEIAAQAVNIVRSFAIGLGIGFLPGMGAGLSNLVAYSSARNASKTPEMFGKGCPDGIWASEVSNNAAIGGSMIPMAALGIPGDSTTALLIGALTIHGLEMGPMVFKNSGNVVYLMFATVMVCALVVLVLQALGMRVFPLILKVPYHYMYPALIIISFVSAYVDSSSLYKCGMMLVFVCIGILMSYGGLPTAPLILAFILGPTLESNMLKSFQYSGSAATFFTRPISCVLMIIGILCIFSPLLRMGMERMKGKKGD